MRKNIIIGLMGIMTFTSCHDLDLNPLSNGSTENWYSTETEVEMAVNELYKDAFWQMDDLENLSGTDWADDGMYRESLTAFQNARLNGQTEEVTRLWSDQFKAIARANGVIQNAHRAVDAGASEIKINRLVAEARFHRACAYAKLMSKFGGVPLVVEELDLEECFKIGRAPLETVKKFVYDEFDAVADVLPVSCSGVQRATCGAAWALKARYALYMGDYDVVVEAARNVMDMNQYSLHENYGDLFLQSTKKSVESIFCLPRSIEFKEDINIQYLLPRNHGGYAAPTPTWDLFASYLCTDGLPVDESPLFDPHNPFKNRDPRLSMTIVPFGEIFMGIEYNPHPEVLEVMDYNKNKMIKNNDTRTVSQYASYTGLIWKKGMDESCKNNSFNIEPDKIVIRYADILLMYAEAMIELGQIDDTVLECINQVRARAYGVDVADKDKYPAVTSTNQKALRTIIRTERRMEFAKEGLRYMDLIRWKLMDEVMQKKVYIMLYPSSLLIENVVEQGNWFWPFAPDIDENGLADFSRMAATGQIGVIAQRQWDERQYLWPIPTTEIIINPHMEQNPGY